MALTHRLSNRSERNRSRKRRRTAKANEPARGGFLQMNLRKWATVVATASLFGFGAVPAHAAEDSTVPPGDTVTIEAEEARSPIEESSATSDAPIPDTPVPDTPIPDTPIPEDPASGGETHGNDGVSGSEDGVEGADATVEPPVGLEPAGEEDGAVQHESGSEDGLDASEPATEQSDETESLNTASADTVAALHLLVANEDGAAQSGVTLEIQGPQAIGTDARSDELWGDSGVAFVGDNQGQPGYVGADLNPSAGEFEISWLEFVESSLTHDITPSGVYRIRPVAAPAGFALETDAQWATVGAVTSSEEPEILTLAAEQSTEDGTDSKTEALTGDEPAELRTLSMSPGFEILNTQETGRYTSSGDSTDPSGWSEGGSPCSACHINSFTSSYQQVGDDWRLLAEWNRPNTGGSMGWAIEYTNAAERWGGSGTQVPQPDRSQGGMVIFIHNQHDNGVYNTQLCTYTSLANYPGSCQNVSPVITSNDGGYTMQMSLTLPESVVGSPGCPSTLGSTGYFRSWTGANNNNSRNIQAWAEPVSVDPPSTCGKIVVNKRVLPGSTAYLAGATFQLYTGGSSGPSSPVNESWATCTIGAAPATSCTMTLPDNQIGANTRFWVVETTPAPGTFSLDELALGSATGNLNSPSPYPGRTPQLVAGETIQMPQAGSSQDGSIGETVNALYNPAIPETCDTGIRIGLVLDRSTSIDANERIPYAAAVRNMVNALVTPQNNIMITPIMFNLTASTGSEQVASSSLANSLYSQLTSSSGWGAGTHWQAALEAAAAGSFDVVLMVTDGAPSMSGSGSANSVRVHHIERAVLAANTVKNGGAPVWAVGVALPNNAVTNLVTISGKNPGDYFLANQWEDLSDELKRIALGLRCSAEINVNKTLQPAEGQAQTNVSGWGFSGTLLAGSDGTLADSGVTKTTNSSVNGGNVTWDHSFTSVGQTASVTFTEHLTTQQIADGWVLTSVTCRDGNDIFPVLLSGNTWSIAGYTLGDAITCTVTNTQQELPADVTWSKVDDQDEPALLSGSEWTIVGPGHAAPGTVIIDCVAAPCTGLDQDPVAGQFELENLAWGSYTVTETKAPEGHSGGNSFMFTVNASNAGTTIALGQFENPRLLGAVVWTKVSADTGDSLGGSAWRLIGPGHDGPAGTIVEDCVEAPCTGLDQDATAGGFLIEDLAWGDYTLVEVYAPLGYVIDSTVYEFTISATTVAEAINLGELENVPVDPLAVPLTGGIGRDHVLLAGFLILAIALSAGVVTRTRSRSRIEVRP